MSSNETEELKEKGNICIKEGKYEEAMLYYTQAIKLDPKNHTLYSNRSLAFLRMQQFYFAFKDAKETIRLNPQWAKGYFRLGEVQQSVHAYLDAIQSYKLALTLQPDDPTLVVALSKVICRYQEESKADVQVPWLGAGLGIILGVSIVISDYALTSSPTLSHPLLMALLTISIAMIGYGLAKGYRYYIGCQKEGLLEPPIDLQTGQNIDGGIDGSGCEEDQINTSGGNSGSSHRYSKAQARFRYKKGKS